MEKRRMRVVYDAGYVEEKDSEKPFIIETEEAEIVFERDERDPDKLRLIINGPIGVEIRTYVRKSWMVDLLKHFNISTEEEL